MGPTEWLISWSGKELGALRCWELEFVVIYRMSAEMCAHIYILCSCGGYRWGSCPHIPLHVPSLYLGSGYPSDIRQCIHAYWLDMFVVIYRMYAEMCTHTYISFSCGGYWWGSCPHIPLHVPNLYLGSGYPSDIRQCIHAYWLDIFVVIYRMYVEMCTHTYISFSCGGYWWGSCPHIPLHVPNPSPGSGYPPLDGACTPIGWICVRYEDA
jgi:hypothetical protein